MATRKPLLTSPLTGSILPSHIGSLLRQPTITRCQPVPAAEGDERAEELARAICVLCPVRESCLEYALTARERDGVWGGMTARERRRILRHRRKSA